jgi:hypothetical protein
MEMASWSTADVEPRRRFEYWCDVVAGTGGGVNAAQPSGHDFDATISIRRLHDVAVTIALARTEWRRTTPQL